MARIAVLTDDVLGAHMAGPAIRAFNIADQLSSAHQVTLVTTSGVPVGGVAAESGFRAVTCPDRELRREVGPAEIVIVQGHVAHRSPWLLRGDQVVVADLYDPLHLEQMELGRDDDLAHRQDAVDLAVRVLNEQMLRADFLLCASEEQRGLWLGHLAALGRVNVTTAGQDPTLRSLLAVCPFGLPSAAPVRASRPIRDGLGLEPDAKVVLWAGGVYDWLDPLTAIHAIDLLRSRRPEVVLVFQGMQHPNEGVAPMAMPALSRRLANELGLTDRHVFFNDTWVPYSERQDHLLDADVGLSTHLDHLESEFAFRSRVLDYLWAGLPVVSTEGDALSALVRREGLGVVVPPDDPERLAAALEALLFDDAAWARAAACVARVRDGFTWDRTLAPLVRFCATPRRAADAALDRTRLVRRPVLPGARLPRLAARAALALRRSGVRGTVDRAAKRARRAQR